LIGGTSYLLDNCDHAGLFKVNMKPFQLLNEANVEPDKVLDYFNTGKSRVRVISDDFWFVEDFIVFQYGGKLNMNNRVHASVYERITNNGINMRSIRGLLEVKKGTKLPQDDPGQGVKDKDKSNTAIPESFQSFPFRDEAYRFADWFNENLRPDSVTFDWEKWAQEYDHLRRADGYSGDDIAKACQWARNDEFWQKNFRSPLKLRRKTPDGEPYIAVFFAQMGLSIKSDDENALHLEAFTGEEDA